MATIIETSSDRRFSIELTAHELRELTAALLYTTPVDLDGERQYDELYDVFTDALRNLGLRQDEPGGPGLDFADLRVAS